MGTERESVWMASPEHIGRSFKWWGYEESGALHIACGNLRFRGRGRELLMPAVVAVSLVRQPIPWLTILVAIGLPAIGISVGAFTTLRWDDPSTIIAFLGISVFFFLAAGPVQWIKVEYRDEGGADGVVYFLNGSGLSRFFGGTRKLYKEIQGIVFNRTI